MISHKKYEYTLIELLVVIAVIGILTSLLFSAMKIGRERMETAECAERQKTIYFGFQDHYNDNRKYPAMSDPDARSSKRGFWVMALGQYVGYPDVYVNTDRQDNLPDDNVLSCQTAINLYNDGYYDDKGGIKGNFNIIGYSMNNHLYSSEFSDQLWSLPDGSSINTYYPNPIRFKHPSELQLIADGRRQEMANGNYFNQSDLQRRYAFDRVRHSNGANVLFCDGRVLWKDEEYWTSKMIELEAVDKNLFYRDFIEFNGTKRSFK